MTNERQPRGQLALRTLALPRDTNPNGDIFGGWLLSQMDIAAGMTASQRVRGRIATVAIDAITFEKPVYVGDIVAVFTEVVRVGNTSLTLGAEAWVTRERTGRCEKVTEGRFTFVAIGDDGRPRPVPPEEPEDRSGAEGAGPT